MYYRWSLGDWQVITISGERAGQWTVRSEYHTHTHTHTHSHTHTHTHTHAHAYTHTLLREWSLESGKERLMWPSRWWEKAPWMKTILLKKPKSWSMLALALFLQSTQTDSALFFVPPLQAIPTWELGQAVRSMHKEWTHLHSTRANGQWWVCTYMSD